MSKEELEKLAYEFMENAQGSLSQIVEVLALAAKTTTWTPHDDKAWERLYHLAKAIEL